MVTTISSIQLSKSLSLFALLSEKPMQRFISIVLYSMTRKILRNKSYGYLSKFQMISSSWSTRNQDINPNANEWVFGTEIYAEMRKPYCKIISYILYSVCTTIFAFVL